MRLVHAGNRVDAQGGAPPRFPASNVPVVTERIGRLLEQLRPDAVVTPAAAGSDLLVLQEALRLGLVVHVVLPFSRDEFRDRSVADRGDAWLRLYDRVLDTVASRHEDCCIVEHDLPATPEGYRRGNQVLLDHARTHTFGGGLLAVAVRPAARDGSASVTDDFVDRARTQGLTCIDLDPSLGHDDMPRAFVAMPFGMKQRGRSRIDCDGIFGKLIVPALEDADLLWQRADKEVDTGLIHLGMIEQLGNSDVVVVDTVTQNPNVFYELGVRHCLADKMTVLLGPLGDSPPFDVGPIRHFSYRLRGGGIEEASALRTIDALRPVLDRRRLAESPRDSPVYEFFELDRVRLRPRGATAAEPSTSLRLHQRVTSAVAARNVPSLLALAEEVRAVRVSRDQRQQLLLRLGIGLRELGRYEDAVDVLEPLAYRPDDGQFTLWTQQLALALRRHGEVAVSAGGDPETAWSEAQGLLDQAIEFGDDPETCGIAAGLQKRRCLRALAKDDIELAASHLASAADLYERGFTSDPSDFYTASNAVTALRILVQHMDGSADQLARARRIAPVAQFFADRAATTGIDGFWAVVTSAELTLTRHLIDGDRSESDVESAYVRAAALRPTPDQARAVLDQLDLYERLGDPPALIARLRGRFEALVSAGT